MPLEAVPPAFEEGPRSSLGAVVPELAEGLLEDVGSIEAPVGLEQLLEAGLAVVLEVLAIREQGVALALDVRPVLARQPPELAASHIIEVRRRGGA